MKIFSFWKHILPKDMSWIWWVFQSSPCFWIRNCYIDKAEREEILSR